jgi:hypothetical protein
MGEHGGRRRVGGRRDGIEIDRHQLRQEVGNGGAVERQHDLTAGLIDDVARLAERALEVRDQGLGRRSGKRRPPAGGDADELDRAGPGEDGGAAP